MNHCVFFYRPNQSVTRGGRAFLAYYEGVPIAAEGVEPQFSIHASCICKHLTLRRRRRLARFCSGGDGKRIRVAMGPSLELL